MSAPAIFVSHSHKDDQYCHALVAGLRAAGLDVWYDEHNASSGHLRTLIERELRLRPIFVVALSPAALASQWVSDECDWAFNLYRRDQAHRVMLPVLAETVNEDDIWLFLQQFKRVEQAGLIPWPAAEAARRVALAVDPNAPLVLPQGQPIPSDSHSDEVDALLARANALVSQGKRREAIEVLRRTTAVAPRSVAAWNALGFNLDYLDQSSESLEVFERVLLLEPNNAFAWAGKANALALDYPQQALAAAENALMLDSRSAYALIGKSYALDSLGRHLEALDTSGQALALDPTFASAWHNKGYVLESLGRYQEALDAYEDAIAIDPLFAIAWSNKGDTLYQLERYQESLDAFEDALAIEPIADNIWQGKANALRKLGRTAEADAAERTAQELDAKK